MDSLGKQEVPSRVFVRNMYRRRKEKVGRMRNEERKYDEWQVL